MKIDAIKLKRLRTERVLSLRELATRAGVTHDSILAIEQGKRQPHPATIRKLASGLGVPPEELLLRDVAENDGEWGERLAQAGWRLYGQENHPAGGATWGFRPLQPSESQGDEVRFFSGESRSEAIQRFLEDLAQRGS